MAKLNMYPNKKLFGISGGQHLRNRYEESLQTRDHFNNNERLMFGNQAAELPDDAFREIEETTLRVYREDEGKVYMNDLMGIARGVNIGKTVHLYRRSTDVTSGVNVSMTGTTPNLIDEVDYNFAGHPVPIFSRGYGLNWRQHMGQQSEGFDGLADNQEAAIADIEQVCAQYVLDGNAKIRVSGYQGYGIKNHPETNLMDLDSSGFNIDLTSFSTTSDNIENFFVRDFLKVLHDNLVDSPVTLYISKQMERRFLLSYSRSAGQKAGTLMDFLLSQPFIDSIKSSYEFDGNEFMAYPVMPKYIRPLIGMATTTIAVPRRKMTDNHNFEVMKALGLEIKADANGRCGVIYAAEMA